MQAEMGRRNRRRTNGGGDGDGDPLDVELLENELDSGAEGVMSNGEAAAEPGKESGLSGVVTGYQCVGEEWSQLYYVWIAGEPVAWMPHLAVWPEAIAKLTGEGLSGEQGSGAQRIVCLAFDLNRLRWVHLVWDQGIAKARYMPEVVTGLPDADGIWV